MNDLLASPTFGGSVEMPPASAGESLGEFFQDVEGVQADLQEVVWIHKRLRESHDSSKTLHDAGAVRDLRSRMDSDIRQALQRAQLIKGKLEALERANAASRGVPGCGPGSSADRTRTAVTSGLRKKLKDAMEKFSLLREQIAQEYKDTVERRYYTVTGEKADDRTVDLLISTGESETFLQKAIQEQGRGRIIDTISEIQERHGAAVELQRGLAELHQVFLDMAVLVQSQGEQIDDIESQVTRANSYVRGAANQLQAARKHQKNTRKWTCYAILLLVIILLIIILPIVLKK